MVSIVSHVKKITIAHGASDIYLRLLGVGNHSLSEFAGREAGDFLKRTIKGRDTGKAGVKGDVDDMHVGIQKLRLSALYPLLRKKVDKCGVGVLLE